eukprot:1437409-Pyramimonas_sp.AAC.1
MVAWRSAPLGLELGAHPVQRVALDGVGRPALRKKDEIDETAWALRSAANKGSLVPAQRVGRQE